MGPVTPGSIMDVVTFYISKQVFPNNQKGLCGKVPFLYTINLPSGQRRVGELEKG